MRIVIAGGGRFFLFKEASFFQATNKLTLFISNFPKRIICKDNISSNKIRNLPVNGYLMYLLHKFLPKHIFPFLFSYITQLLHQRFGLFIKKNVVDADIYLILSSFALESIHEIRKKSNALIIIEHASFHQQEDRDLVILDAIYWNVKPSSDLSPKWVIEKENQEFALADYVLVPSKAVKKSLIKHGVLEHKILTNAYGVDLVEFYPYNVAKNKFRVIQVGQISQRKGIFTTIKAFINANVTNSELVFIGSLDVDIREIKKFAGHRFKDIYFKKAINQNKLIYEYGVSSVMVMSSVSDGFGLVVPQALACGVPVLVSENVGSSEFIIDGYNGFTFKIRDVDTLSNLLIRFSENRNMLYSMSLNAHNSAKNNLKWSDYYTRLNDLLINLI